MDKRLRALLTTSTNVFVFMSALYLPFGLSRVVSYFTRQSACAAKICPGITPHKRAHSVYDYPGTVPGQLSRNKNLVGNVNEVLDR